MNGFSLSPSPKSPAKDNTSKMKNIELIKSGMLDSGNFLLSPYNINFDHHNMSTFLP